jgi:hypothetical protein
MKRILALSLVLVVGVGVCAFAFPLSGTWEVEIGLNPQTPALTAFDSTLNVDYTVATWTFGSLTQFELSGWVAQSFSANGTIGACTAASLVVFNPMGAAFSYWNSTISIAIARVTLGGSFHLTSAGSGWMFNASGVEGDLSFSAAVFFNSYLDTDGMLQLQTDSYCFCFTSVEFDISFPFACIDLVDVSLSLSAADGFDGITFSLDDVALPGLPFLAFDLDLTFSTQTEGKVLTIVPTINLDSDCIIIYAELVTGSSDWIITGLNIYGVGLMYSWNGLSFASYSSFDPDKNADLTGESEYWEVFTITNSTDSCCGGGFEFSVSTYFSCDSTALFDWGETDIEVSVGIGSNFTLSTGILVDTTRLKEWTIGFTVTW